MSPEKTEKCAHPLCSCVATTGKHCCAECAAVETTPGIACPCQHPGCASKKL